MTHCLTESDLLSYKTSFNRKTTIDSCSSSMSSLPTYPLFNENPNLVLSNEMLVINEETDGQRHDCDGCSLKCKSTKGSFNGFICFDSNKKFGFITNSYPIERNDSKPLENKISYAVIRDACIRSLSCEVYENGRDSEGLIYFGDDQRGHILSYLFVLQDSKARGFQRTYSILVIGQNKHQLLNDWDFYVKHIEHIVLSLKNKAKIIYESELTQTTCQQRRSLILDNVSNIGPNLSSLEDILDRNPLNTHRTNSKARSILELTGDNTTFANLHIQFSWLLLAVNSLNQTNSMIASNQSNLTSVLPIDQNLSLRHFYTLVGKEKFQTIAYNTVIGNKIIVCDTNNCRLKSLIHCLSQLLPDECINAKTNCQTFDESSKLNFIGISSLDVLSNNPIESQFYILINIKDQQIDKQSNNLLSNDLKISVHSMTKLPERMPNYLTNVENILTDLTYSDSTFNSYLISLKNEWLNKAQVLYSYTKGVNPPRTTSEINLFLKLIQIEDWDSKLISFWSSSGLSIEFKTKAFSVNSETNLLNENETINA